MRWIRRSFPRACPKAVGVFGPSLGRRRVPGGAWVRLGLALAILALVLQGLPPFPAGKGKTEAGLHAKGPAWVPKEDRQGNGLTPLAQAPTRPPHFSVKPQNREAKPPSLETSSPSHLYLLYGRLQMDGG
ncbi:hypothetical protein [Thermus antranikianii]|uniref:hypothetical protein n=1 Tax=Thermus antranikianii TaxID=88190 RepID=UPI002349BD05|nr:hypothetical protein [Thermus antranikianii]